MIIDNHINDAIIEILKGLKETIDVNKPMDFPQERYFPPN